MKYRIPLHLLLLRPALAVSAFGFLFLGLLILGLIHRPALWGVAFILAPLLALILIGLADFSIREARARKWRKCIVLNDPCEFQNLRGTFTQGVVVGFSGDGKQARVRTGSFSATIMGASYYPIEELYPVRKT